MMSQLSRLKYYGSWELQKVSTLLFFYFSYLLLDLKPHVPGLWMALGMSEGMYVLIIMG